MAILDNPVWPRRYQAALLLLPVLCMLGLLVLPLLAIFMKAWPQQGLWETLRQPLVTQALRLSVVTSVCSLLVAMVFGTPLAYLLARYRFRGSGLLDTLMDLPMVLPPTVAGVALLMAFGRRGLLGPWLDAVGLQIGFTPVAVVLAQSFVSTPFYTRAAQAAFRSVAQELERVAYTLGHSYVYHQLGLATDKRILMELQRHGLHLMPHSRPLPAEEEHTSTALPQGPLTADNGLETC